MSYTKQTWQAGDEITSAKLNHLEDGINNVATEVANFPVEINNPQDGDTLIYNAAEQKWISGSNSGGSSGGILKVGIDMETGTFDKTWKEIYDASSAGYYVNCVADGEGIANQLSIISSYVGGPGNYVINGFAIDNDHVAIYKFVADSENGYPVRIFND